MKLIEFLKMLEETASANNISTPYICGGTPRDKYMNRAYNVSDIDITTGDQTIHNLGKLIFKKLEPIGAVYKLCDDGHSKVMLKNLKLDFSSNYVSPTQTEKKLQNEMVSRDFTCNALLMSTNLKEIYDPLNSSLSDIDNKIIKTCMDPNITLKEDPRRIPRVFYLSSKLDFKISDDIMQFISSNKDLLSSVPQEYISKRMVKACSYNLENTVKLLDETGIWEYIPPIKPLQKYIKERLVSQ